MTPREQLGRERFYRYASICLALATALFLVPADWIPRLLEREQPREPEPRPVKIVRVPPDTLPPPPPLPPRPKPKPKPKPRPEPPPEPEVQKVVELKPMLEEPEIEIPREQRQERQVKLDADARPLDLRARVEVPEVEVPRERKPRPDLPKVAVEKLPDEIAKPVEDVEVTVPKLVPRKADVQEIRVAAATVETFHDVDAPDVDVATPRPSARKADRPSLLPVSQQLKTGVAVKQALDAPAVDVPRGNTARPNRAAPVAVSGAVTGTRVVYDANPGNAPEVAVASPRKATRKGAAPRLAATKGGVPGLKYSVAAADAPVGSTAPGKVVSRRAARIEGIRAMLARKYGLPLVSVNDLGQRSTEAARWNLLLPEISDLVRQTRKLGSWRGGPNDEVVSVERDGKSLIIRYRDGIVHVIVPTDDGLVALFVARSKGARPVVSKVQEAESARSALYRYARGAS